MHFVHPRARAFVGEKRIVASIDRIGELSVLQISQEELLMYDYTVLLVVDLTTTVVVVLQRS